MSRKIIRASVLMFAFAAIAAHAQLATSAYRVLGQPDLQRNIRNQIVGAELRQPLGLTLDRRNDQTFLFVADTANHRVLAWADTGSGQVGPPAVHALGQPSLQHAFAFGVNGQNCANPTSVAIDPQTGDVYVADFGANRVLRFRNPFDHPGASAAPTAVFGQTSFTGSAANAGGPISATALRGPIAVAVDGNRNLWVADRDNNRVLRFPPSALAEGVRNPAADLVLGQADFGSSLPNRGQAASAASLRTPSGLAFDSQGRLLVADTGNNRVLVYTNPTVNGQAASAVVGQPNFTTVTIPTSPSNSSLRGPVGVAADSTSIYVSTVGDHRILVFPAAGGNVPATFVYGQPAFNTGAANQGSAPRASNAGLNEPAALAVDSSNGLVYVADSLNNRVLAFEKGSKTAISVWGQGAFEWNAPNRLKPASISGPADLVIDYSQEPYPLYVADIQNHRVLGWRDSIRWSNGQPADLVIGQPDFETAIPNSDTSNQSPTATSLSAPRGLAVDSSGALYVSDSGNHRVLRYPRPFDQQGRVTPDLVIGQPDFTTAALGAVSASSLRSPAGLAVSPLDSVLVADAGNNRVLEFPNGATTAVRVFGQPGFTSGNPPSVLSAQTLAQPLGVAVDQFFTVYVADTSANRVLIYTNILDATEGLSADIVLGQPNFTTGAGSVTAARMQLPTDVSIDRQGRILVADAGNNRILQFPPSLTLPSSDGAASAVFGQPNFTTRSVAIALDGFSTPSSLNGPVAVFADRVNTIYIGDAGNNRVLHVLLRAGLVNAANPQSSTLAPGAIAWMQGPELTDGAEAQASAPLPVSLAGRTVIFNDTSMAPLQSASQSRIVLQIPAELQPGGAVRFAVRSENTSELIAGGSATISSVAPAIYTVNGTGSGQASVLNENGANNGASNPAARGSTITILANGQGALQQDLPNGTLPEGSVATLAKPTTDLQRCVASGVEGTNLMCVVLGTSALEVTSSAMSPERVGVWEIKARIPANLATTGNSVTMVLLVNGARSNSATIAVRP